MESIKTDIVSRFNELSFGELSLDKNEISFYKKLNSQIFTLCVSLPESIQTDSMLFLMNYFRCSVGISFEFFKNYYAPSWLIVYHIVNLSHKYSSLSQEEVDYSIIAQSMAMFLHSLDDHLHDKTVPVSHLVLMIRSQAWKTMTQAIDSLTGGMPEFTSITKDLINDYYSSISAVLETETVNDYCELFRKQMATWMIIPMINAKKICNDDSFMSAIKNSYESFGIAWRLLDDLNDIYFDLTKKVHSSVYLSLPDYGKNLWNTFSSVSEPADKQRIIEELKFLFYKHDIINSIIRRIYVELKCAENSMHSQGLVRFADQYRSLGDTLQQWIH